MWISVEKSLPQQLKRALVTDGDDLFIAWLEQTRTGLHKYWRDESGKLNDITHWCMPELPEKDDDNE